MGDRPVLVRLKATNGLPEAAPSAWGVEVELQVPADRAAEARELVSGFVDELLELGALRGRSP